MALLGLDGPPRRRDGWLAAGLGLTSAAAHLLPGIVFGHDTLDHLWGAWAWLQAWTSGDLFPLWLHQVGAGLPQPQFYGPLAYWAMAPLALLGLGAPSALSGSLALAGAVSGLSAWGAVANWTRDRRAALLAALAWSYAPYRLLDANYRGALGETWALALLPWVVLAFERVATRPGHRRIRSAAFAVALVALAHPLSLVLLAALIPVLTALAAEPWRRGARQLARAWTRAAASALAGFGLAAFFLVPLVVGLGSIDLDAGTRAPWAPRYRAEGIHPAQLLERRGWSEL
ncbi:MAG TPA: 6-pyruvoyl-tetrahydropterin synthase-related protein, partial [Thermoanaerobaculia bacterium]|nr:6-pyruvoyl-tetrahydropterin synthase-related protein [Thermoanaerobaculia bacterium]